MPGFCGMSCSGGVIGCGVPGSFGVSYSPGGLSGLAGFPSHGGATVCGVPDCVGVFFSGEITGCEIPGCGGMSFHGGVTGCGVPGWGGMSCHGGVTVCGVPGCVGMSFRGVVTGYRVLDLGGMSCSGGVTVGCLDVVVPPWWGDWLWNSWPQGDVLPRWDVPLYGMSYLVRVPGHGVIPIKAGAAGLSIPHLLRPTLEVVL